MTPSHNDQPGSPKTSEETISAARKALVERLLPAAERTAVSFASALRATLSGMPDPDRRALLDRAATFFTEALNKATGDVMLVCLYGQDDNRATMALRDFLTMRAANAALQQFRK